MTAPEALSSLTPPTIARRPFDRVSFSRQFVIISSLVLIIGMSVIGRWISLEIEHSAINRAAAIAAVYVESILVAQLPVTADGIVINAETHAALDRIFTTGPLRRKVVRFKLWDTAGTIRYSSHPTQIGERHPADGMYYAALAGTLQAHITNLEETEHEAERERWQRLLEVLVPVRGGLNGEVIGVAEFYHATENLDRDIQNAQQRSWALLIVSTLAIFLLLFVQVRRANATIRQQRNDLRQQLQQLRRAFAENERMRLRLGEAGAATTALNEEFLHRIAADLHDAPAQTLAFALMRFDEMLESCGGCGHPEQQNSPDLKAIRAALSSSLDDLRNIAAGIGIPGIADLSLADTARRAIRDFERHAGVKVKTAIEGDVGAIPLATKITLFRLLQESLTNCAKHAPGSTPEVRVCQKPASITVEVSDTGIGFDTGSALRSGRLGLSFMQERVRLLGGTIHIDSGPGRGTRVFAELPLVNENCTTNSIP